MGAYRCLLDIVVTQVEERDICEMALVALYNMTLMNDTKVVFGMNTVTILMSCLKVSVVNLKERKG